jgi:hypothetical protein
MSSGGWKNFPLIPVSLLVGTFHLTSSHLLPSGQSIESVLWKILTNLTGPLGFCNTLMKVNLLNFYKVQEDQKQEKMKWVTNSCNSIWTIMEHSYRNTELYNWNKPLKINSNQWWLQECIKWGIGEVFLTKVCENMNLKTFGSPRVL